MSFDLFNTRLETICLFESAEVIFFVPFEKAKSDSERDIKVLFATAILPLDYQGFTSR